MKESGFKQSLVKLYLPLNQILNYQGIPQTLDLGLYEQLINSFSYYLTGGQ
jgi:hypothetical protein